MLLIYNIYIPSIHNYLKIRRILKKKNYLYRMIMGRKKIVKNFNYNHINIGRYTIYALKSIS